jgi:predicted hydrolase (HD superfamily)
VGTACAFTNLKLRRNTSAPARKSASIISGVLHDSDMAEIRDACEEHAAQSGAILAKLTAAAHNDTLQNTVHL